MTIRIRKLVGAVALILLVTVWSLLAMGFAPLVLTSDSRLAEIAYYAIAGFCVLLATLSAGVFLHGRHGS